MVRLYDLNGNAAKHMNLPLSEDQMASRGSPTLGYTEMKGSWFIFDTYRAHDDWCRWRAPIGTAAGSWALRATPTTTSASAAARAWTWSEGALQQTDVSVQVGRVARRRADADRRCPGGPASPPC